MSSAQYEFKENVIIAIKWRQRPKLENFNKKRKLLDVNEIFMNENFKGFFPGNF